MTSSFLLVLNLNKRHSSSVPISSSTILPALAKKPHTSLATSSALLSPPELPGRPSVASTRLRDAKMFEVEAGGWTGSALEFSLVEINPEVRTMSPVSRRRISVDCTPGFWERRVKRAVVSSGCGNEKCQSWYASIACRRAYTVGCAMFIV